MNIIDSIEYSLNMSHMLVQAYVGDLTQEDWMVRPVEGANHITWQIGHLIQSTNQLGEICFPGAMPELPEGFGDKYTKEKASSDDPAEFDSKDELMSLYETQRAALLKAVAVISDDDLVKPAPENLEQIAKTVGELCVFQPVHWLMHAGQWAIIRRKLGHPPIF